MGQQAARTDRCPVCGDAVGESSRLDLTFNVMVFTCQACAAPVADTYSALRTTSPSPQLRRIA